MLNYDSHYDYQDDRFEQRLQDDFQLVRDNLVGYLSSFVNGIIGDLFIKMFLDAFENDVDGAKEIADKLNLTEEDICILKGNFDMWSKLYYDMPTQQNPNE